MLRITVWIQVIHLRSLRLSFWGFPVGLVCKESSCKAEEAGDACSIPGLGRSPGGRHGNPLQHSFLKMDRGNWQGTVHGGRKKLDTTEATEHPPPRLSFHFIDEGTEALTDQGTS